MQPSSSSQFNNQLSNEGSSQSLRLVAPNPMPQPLAELTVDSESQYAAKRVRFDLLKDNSIKKWMSSLLHLSSTSPTVAGRLFDFHADNVSFDSYIHHSAGVSYLRLMDALGRPEAKAAFIKELFSRDNIPTGCLNDLARRLNAPDEVELRIKVLEKSYELRPSEIVRNDLVDLYMEQPGFEKLKLLSQRCLEDRISIRERVDLIDKLLSKDLVDEARPHMVKALLYNRSALVEHFIFRAAGSIFELSIAEKNSLLLVSKRLLTNSIGFLSDLENGESVHSALRKAAPTPERRAALLEEVALCFRDRAYEFKSVAHETIVSLQLTERGLLPVGYSRAMFLDSANCLVSKAEEFVAMRRERGVLIEDQCTFRLVEELRHTRPDLAYDILSPISKFDKDIYRSHA